MVVAILLRLKRPVTIDGVIFSVTPFPFEVEMSELQTVIPVPPPRASPVPMEHVAVMAEALKFPLLCAFTKLPAPNRIANAKIRLMIAIFFILSSFHNQLTFKIHPSGSPAIFTQKTPPFTFLHAVNLALPALRMPPSFTWEHFPYQIQLSSE
jgi:hypothetical protein